jgi:hypothetical protein
MMKVVLVVVNKDPVITEIDNSLKGLQAVVGGYIESVSLSPYEHQLVLICNEEGKLIGLPPNRLLGNDIIMGTFFITKANDEGDFVSLDDDDLVLIQKNYLTDLELEGSK